MDFLNFLDEPPLFSEASSFSREKRQRSVSSQRMPELLLSEDTSSKLFPHQVEGIHWLWRRHFESCGSILADEMGLGKTVQVCIFLGELFRAHLITTTLIIVPPTLVPMWKESLSKWGRFAESAVFTVHRGSKKMRIEKWGKLRHGIPCVCLSTYGVVKSDISVLGKIPVDYAILDEAHIVKDSTTDVHKAVRDLQPIHRLAVTGTPVMNNYNDLWSIMSFVDPALLGLKSDFQRINLALMRGNESDATNREKNSANDLLNDLREKTRACILRREKCNTSAVLSKKEEVVVWVRPTECQLNQYNNFIKSDIVQVALQEIKTSQPLVLLSALKRLCDHPWLNFNEANFKLAIASAGHLSDFPDFGNVRSGPKVGIALSLIRGHISKNERTLVFSRSKRLLTLLGMELDASLIKYSRIDGDVLSEERTKVIDLFNSGAGGDVCLSTTHVGGSGVTFCGSSRVILLDPSWNPACDAQAVDRVHRIGQEKDVVVYRLITSGTVDEKVYRNQVFKLMAAKHVNMDENDCSKLRRYFTRLELRNMFDLGNTSLSETAHVMNAFHPMSISNSILELIESFVEPQELAGLSSHSSIFTTGNENTRVPQTELEDIPPDEHVRECSPEVKKEVQNREDSQELINSLRLHRCSIFLQGPLDQVEPGVSDAPDAFVMFRGMKIPRIQLSMVHRESTAIDFPSEGFDSDSSICLSPVADH